MTNPIVVVNGTVLTAPAPLTLQQTGAIVSQGATNRAPQTYSLLTQLSDLTSILAGALTLSTLSWTGGTVTATTAAPHGFAIDSVIWLTIAGVVPAGYNGAFLCTATGASTFTYPLASALGAESTPGTYTEEDVAELVEQATTFFGMGSQTSVSVLELGPGSPAAGVAALSNFITATTPQIFYAYLVPRMWSGEPTFLTFAATFEAVTAKTYFFVTSNLQNYSNYTTTMKSVLALIEAPAGAVWPANALTAISWTTNFISATTTVAHGVSPGQWFQISGCTPAGYNGWYLAADGTTGSTLIAYAPTNPGAESGLGTLVASSALSSGVGTTEFSLADAFWTVLSWNPSSSNNVTPLSFAYMYGSTAFPLQGNSALLTTLLTANINYVGTGQEGGTATSILRNGRTLDGNQFNFWYATDWIQINGDLDLTAAVIKGSNNPLNPLWNNQSGITALQGVLGQTCSTGIAAGLLLGSLIFTELAPAAFALNVENGVYDGQVVVNAVPFATYYSANPGNYKTGVYGGFSVAFTPQTGFQQIIVNMTAVQFAAAA